MIAYTNMTLKKLESVGQWLVLIGIFFLIVYQIFSLTGHNTKTTTSPRRTNHFEISKECLKNASSTKSINEQVALLRVVDGDTIDIERPCGNDRVRLIGINTPETVDPRRPVQCFGREATAHITELLNNKSIRIETDPTQATRDIYSRLLAYIYVPSSLGTSTSSVTPEENVNGRMIKDGYAYEYTYKIPYTEQKNFKEYQKTAQNELAGLWSPKTCNGKK